MKNEKKFEQQLSRIKNLKLSSHKQFSTDDGSKDHVKIEIDYMIEIDDFQILFEVDSYNMAKVVCGEYVLLNLLYEWTKGKKPIFVIIHYYNKYNSERTVKSLNIIDKKLLNNEKKIPFVVFSEAEWNNFIEKINDVVDLKNKLINYDYEK